jgi:hypothetical protein
VRRPIRAARQGVGKMLDTLAGIVIGTFLVVVASQGKTADMIALAKRDRAFLQWAVAVGILLYLRGIPELAEPVKWLIVLAFLGLFLTKSGEIQKNAGEFWKSLGA